MIWLLWASMAFATRVEADMLPCAVGEEPTRVYRLLAKDSFGGWDSDGARYSLRGQWRSYAVATCPSNYLSLTSGDMRKPLTEPEKEALKPLLAELADEVTDPEQLEVWDRWLMATRAYEALERDPWFIANVYLQAAWTVRDAAVGVYEEGLHGPSHVRAYLVAGEAELARTDITAEQRRVLQFNLVRMAHRGGFTAERNALLQALRDQDLNDAESQALAALERAAILEPQIFEKAAAHLALVADDASRTDEQRLHARYLLADIARRSGKLDEAAVGFEAVRRQAKDDPSMLGLATYLAAESRGEAPYKRLAKPVELEAPSLSQEQLDNLNLTKTPLK